MIQTLMSQRKFSRIKEQKHSCNTELKKMLRINTFMATAKQTS